MEPRIARLDRALADTWASALVELNADSTWDSWNERNITADRPGKWDFSLVAFGLEQQPIAYAIISLSPSSSHLHHLVIGKEHRGLGIGRTLVERWLTEATGVRNRATLKVHPDNTVALQFYENLDFVRTGRSTTGYLEFERPIRNGSK